MRVLVVARWYPSHDAPGRGSFVADQVRALRGTGVDVVVASWDAVIARSPDSINRATAEWAAAIERAGAPLAIPVRWGAGVPVARLPAVVPGDVGARHPVEMARLQAATLVAFGTALDATWPFDLIHAHTGLPDGCAAVELAERLGLPLVTTEHDGSLDVRLADGRAREAYRSLTAAGRRFIAVSDRLAAQAADLSGIAPTSIEVIPNLVDLELFKPNGATERRPGELLWIGNRKASKGMEALLGAFSLVARSRPGVRLRLIGQAPTPDDESALRALASELAIADRVSFEEPAPRAEVAAAMARADLFVHPSPRESFGIVAVEALASGLPVVAVAPTVADLIGRTGRLGEISERPDAPALAAAISRALERRAEFDPADLMAAARPYGAPAVAGRINAVYRGAVGGPGRSGSPDPATTAPLALLVVAGRRRAAIERIGPLAADSAARLTVVTRTATDGSDPPSDGTWIEVDTEASFQAALRRLGMDEARTVGRARPGRWLELVRHPRRTIARRRLFADRGRLASATFAAAVVAAHGRLAEGVPVMALEADDAVTIGDAGLAPRLAPATVRSIADRLDEVRGPRNLPPTHSEHRPREPR